MLIKCNNFFIKNSQKQFLFGFFEFITNQNMKIKNDLEKEKLFNY